MVFSELIGPPSVLFSELIVLQSALSSMSNMLADGLEALRAAEAPLLVLGALTAAWLAVRAVGCLLAGLRVWVLGNGRLVSPGSLGQWAGEACLGARERAAGVPGRWADRYPPSVVTVGEEAAGQRSDPSVVRLSSRSGDTRTRTGPP